MLTCLTVYIIGMSNADVSKFKCPCQPLDGKKNHINLVKYFSLVYFFYQLYSFLNFFFLLIFLSILGNYSNFHPNSPIPPLPNLDPPQQSDTTNNCRSNTTKTRLSQNIITIFSFSLIFLPNPIKAFLNSKSTNVENRMS